MPEIMGEQSSHLHIIIGPSTLDGKLLEVGFSHWDIVQVLLAAAYARFMPILGRKSTTIQLPGL